MVELFYFVMHHRAAVVKLAIFAGTFIEGIIKLLRTSSPVTGVMEIWTFFLFVDFFLSAFSDFEGEDVEFFEKWCGQIRLKVVVVTKDVVER